jgi:hypothetical protein
VVYSFLPGCNFSKEPETKATNYLLISFKILNAFKIHILEKNSSGSCKTGNLYNIEVVIMLLTYLLLK